MTLKRYKWKVGPDLIEHQGDAKHRILQIYLTADFLTLVSSPDQDLMCLTLWDGFLGSGPTHLTLGNKEH